ncbi:MAG: hypothetical protein FJ098_06335 [Deltaproteobacteria bacterium]|nr:hypothetical protein [Deltaproteobacteria bacterium]
MIALRCLPGALAVLLLLVPPACDSGGDGGGGTGGDTAPLDTAADTDTPAGTDSAGDAGLLPDPPLAPVTLDNGTFAWAQGDRRLSFAVHDGTVLLLETFFDCTGGTGCKVQNDVATLTCNQAFEKGYTATIADNTFVLGGIKKTDTLTAILWDSTTVKFLYQVSPGFCCEASFTGEAKWASSEDCAGFEVKDCDPYTDAECPGGQNCIFGVGDQPVCMPAGDKAVGEECAAQAQCSDGVCMGIQSVEGQHCFEYCKSDGDCGGGIQCLSLEGEDWKICGLSAEEYETCNLLSQNCQDPLDGCYWSASPINKPICLPAGAAGKKEPCGSSSDCQKGLDCLNNGKCYQICNVVEGGEPSCESPFTNCVENYGPQGAGWCDE